MRRIIIPVALFLIAALIGHFATLNAVPGVIMNMAMERMADAGLKHHQFALSPRTTPQTQTVVRPSPDLAYSICTFDLSGGQALKVQTGLYDNYTSVSFFDDRTINFSTVRVGAGARPASGSEVVLLAPGKAELSPEVFSGLQVEAPSERGLILIRRLAPTEAEYATVIEASVGDQCGLLTSVPSDGD
ncbi:MAG: DUF1254 domain-containing protein [Pseudomonadota bacterium]